jgi:YVTN family beta-propeller protein
MDRGGVIKAIEMGLMAAVLLAVAILAAGMCMEARAATATHDYLFAVSEFNNNITVVDTQNNQIANLTGLGPRKAVVASPDGKKVYAANETRVIVINTSTNEVIATIAGDVYAGAAYIYELAVSPDGSRLYATDSARKNLRILNTMDYREIGEIKPDAGEVFRLVAVSPDGNRLYLYSLNSSDEYHGNIYAFDAHTKARLAKITTDYIRSIALSPDGNSLYATVRTPLLKYYVYIYRAPDLVKTGAITAAADASGIAFNPGGTRAYVANLNDGTVSVIDTGSKSIIRTVSVLSGPNKIALTSDGKTAYVSCYNKVSVVNTSTYAVTTLSTPNYIDDMAVCGIPVSIAFLPGTGFVNPGLIPLPAPSPSPSPGPAPTSASSPTPEAPAATPTPGAVPTAVPTALPSGEPAATGAAPTSTIEPAQTATPAPDGGRSLECLGFPVVTIGGVLLLGPLAGRLRRKG